MSQVILARMYISDQEKSPFKIDKTKWVKQHNFSTQTLYRGLWALKNAVEPPTEKPIQDKVNLLLPRSKVHD